MNPFRSLCTTCTLLALAAASSLPAGAESTPAPAQKQVRQAIPLSGKVAETMDGGGYTYLLLKPASGEKVWVAIPQMKLSVGQEVSLMPGYEMKNLNSKSLNRKFDRIIFSGGLSSQKEVQMTPEAIKNAHKGFNMNAPAAAAKTDKTPAASEGAAKPAAPASTPAAPPAPKPIKVAKAKGANAYTVAELYGRRAQLEKKKVTVRGRVVKVASRILKRNWIHIQDGTGSDKLKNNDLVLTSKTLPKEGAVITAKGVLRNRIDVGSGYKYELIVLDASIK